MNTGVISLRYAKALMKYVQETGGGDRACKQAVQLLDHPELELKELCPELEALVKLLIENGRLEYVRYVLNSFVRLYKESVGIKTAWLKTVVDSPEFSKRIRDIVEDRTGYKIQLKTLVEPALIGGFVLEIDDYRLDSSIRGELEMVRRSLTEKSERLK